MKNKISQAQRREIRKFVNSQYMILNDVLRQRPRWIPLKLWGLGAKIFIDTEKLSRYMQGGLSTKDKR